VRDPRHVFLLSGAATTGSREVTSGWAATWAGADASPWRGRPRSLNAKDMMCQAVRAMDPPVSSGRKCARSVIIKSDNGRARDTRRRAETPLREAERGSGARETPRDTYTPRLTHSRTAVAALHGATRHRHETRTTRARRRVTRQGHSLTNAEPRSVLYYVVHTGRVCGVRPKTLLCGCRLVHLHKQETAPRTVCVWRVYNRAASAIGRGARFSDA
jgi:hypothetical protein